VKDDVWRRNAEHANHKAKRLVEGISALPGVTLWHPLQANEIFVQLPAPVIEGLEVDGFLFHTWGNPSDNVVRLVAGFSTTDADVDRIVMRTTELSA